MLASILNAPRLLLVALAASASNAMAEPAVFVDVAASVMPPPDTPATKKVFSVQIVDMNGDGRLDIISGGHGPTNDRHIYLNDPSGKFRYIDNGSYQRPSNGTNNDVNRITSSDTIFDIDGNGCPDITGWDADGGYAGYIACESSSAGDVVYRPRIALVAHWSNRAVFWDYDGDTEFETLSIDGKHARCDQSGKVMGPRSDGKVFFRRDETTIRGVGCLGQEAFGIVDINNDGWPEAFHSGRGRTDADNVPSFVVDNVDGALTLRSDGIPPFERGSRRWTFGDFDSDGDQDLFLHAGQWQRDGGNRSYLLENLGDGTFRDVTVGSGVEGQEQAGQDIDNEDYWTTYSNSRVIDFDLDSRPDIFFAAESYGRAFIVLHNVTAPGGPIRFDVQRPAWARGANDGRVGKQFVAVGDLDGDGLIDAVTPQRNGLAVYRNKTRGAADRHWLRVRLRGKGRNTHAAHATITAREPGTDRVITSYQINPSFSSYLMPHLGLGDHDVVDLDIVWPGLDGECTSRQPCRTRYEDVATDRAVVIDWQDRNHVRDDLADD